jgi:hypothetical protein
MNISFYIFPTSFKTSVCNVYPIQLKSVDNKLLNNSCSLKLFL